MLSLNPNEDLFSFDWQRHVDGYEVTERIVRPSGEVLRVIQPKGKAVGVYSFGPEHAGLFREFAALEQTPHAVEGFANSYGLLWQQDADFELYESQWLVSIAVMSKLVEAVDKALSDAVDAHKLDDALYWLHSDQLPVAFAPRIEPNEKKPSHPKYRLIPTSLTAALWQQAANQVIRGTTFKQCENCPRWFPVGPGTGGRSDKRSCSERCRVALYRARKAGGHHAR